MRHGGLLVTLASVLSGCATISAGHAGVLLRRGGVAPDPLEEGVHFVGPFAEVEIYDLRAQEHTEDLASLSADGAALEARASVLTFHPVPGELIALAREVGPDVYGKIVGPIVRATVRRVLAGWRADQLDSAGILRAQAEIARISAERLRPYHVVLDDVNMRTLALTTSSGAYARILERAVEEQTSLTIPHTLELARRHADERRQAARGIADAHATVAPTLTPGVLSDAETRAWSALLQAPSTTVEVRSARSPQMMEVSP